MEMTLAEMARRLGGTVEGDGAIRIGAAAGLREARAGDISFLADPRYAPLAAATRASALVVGRDAAVVGPAALLRVDRPGEAFQQIALWFAPPPVRPAPGIHPTAVIAPDARLGQDVSVGPLAVVEAGAAVGDRTALWAGCYLGPGVRVGADCTLYPHVSVREHCEIGDRVILHNGVVVGSDGFGYQVGADGARTKIPQIGTVSIGDDVEIGANSTVDRARFGRTRIGRGVKIDNLVQIAHNVVIGDHAVLVAQVGIAGSTVIGPHAVLAGQVGVAGHLEVGAGAVIGAQSGLHKDVPAGARLLGSPAVPNVQFARNHANVMRLEEIKKQLRDLERRLSALEAGGA